MSQHGLSRPDELLLSRYVDGELSGDELSEFRQRVENELALRSALQEIRELRSWFRAGDGTVTEVSSGFAVGVMAEVRRLPSRLELARAVDADPAAELELVGFARRVLMAAAIVLGLALALASGLFTRGDASRLEASPAELQRAMDEIDAGIRATGEPVPASGELRDK